LSRVVSELGDKAKESGLTRIGSGSQERDREKAKAAVGMAETPASVPQVIKGAVVDEWPLYR
jgi:hypothetical protein